MPVLGPGRSLPLPAIALAIALALATAGLVPAAAPAASRCSAKGSTTVAENRLARVYQSRLGDLSGCLKDSGSRLRLLTGEPDAYTVGTFDLVRLAGRQVAFSAEVTDSSCKANCPPDYDPTVETVRVADLASRRRRALPATATSLAVNRSGAVAWTQTQADGAGSDLHLSRAGTAQEVVAAGDVALVGFAGRYLLWRSAGEPGWMDVSG